MPHIVYRGPHDVVELPTLGIVAERDEPVEVADDEVAENLIAQGWESPVAKRQSKEKE